jgi:hypothetical protein
MYSPFSASARTLKVVRRGWFRASFTLTDGKVTYGELTYSTFFRRKASVKTASVSWTFQNKFLSRKISITDQNGSLAGELRSKWFSRNTELTLTNGAVFTFLLKSFWKRRYFWADIKGNEVLGFKPNFFSKNILNVDVEKNLLPDETNLLLAFLGTHLIILKRRRRAAAAAH